MTQRPSLQDITLDIIARYNAAGKHLVGAWSASAQNALRVFAACTSALPMAAPRMADACQAFEDFWTDTVQKDAARAIRLIDMVADHAADGVQSMTSTARRVQGEPFAGMLGALDALNLPLAQFSLKVASTIATGAESLETRMLNGEMSVQKVTTVQAKVHSTPAVAGKQG